MSEPLVIEESLGRRIAVSSGHRAASEIAVKIYLDGGNVVDAAIAGACVLGVVLPYACGIGGDAYLMYRNARTGVTHALNGTGAAPSGASLSLFAKGIPTTGIHAPTVPGVVALWEDALAKFGTRSLRELLQPAIRACDGIDVHRVLVENIDHKRVLLSKDAESSKYFLPRQQPLAIGSILVQADLGRVLQRIADRGAKEFYEGELAAEFVEKTTAAGGLFSYSDLAAHRTLVQTPLRTEFYDHSILTMPPNSVGFHLLFQLRALQAARIDRIDPERLEFWQAMIAAWRWSSDVSKDADGDPRDAESVVSALLKSIENDPPSLSTHGVKSQAAPPSGDTSNIVVMDAEGNCVSLLQSVSAPFASGIVVPGMGILLNNRMRGFNTQPDHINCVAPGRRPKHTLVPVVVLRNDKSFMVLGTPGAAGQPVTLAQVLTRVLAHKQSLADAAGAPRWSVGLAGEIIVEPSMPTAIIDALRSDEPNLAVMSERHVRFGSIKAATLDTGCLRTVADYRRVAATATA